MECLSESANGKNKDPGVELHVLSLENRSEPLQCTLGCWALLSELPRSWGCLSLSLGSLGRRFVSQQQDIISYIADAGWRD